MKIKLNGGILEPAITTVSISKPTSRKDQIMGMIKETWDYDYVKEAVATSGGAFIGEILSRYFNL
jgi:hypothetical protein